MTSSALTKKRKSWIATEDVYVFGVNRIYIFAAVAMVCCMLTTVKTLFSFVAFLICLYVVIFDTEENKIALIAGLIPLANVFKLSVGGISCFTYIILIYDCLYLWKEKKVPYAIVLFTLVILAQEFSSLAFDWKTITKFAGNLLFIYYAYKNMPSSGYKKVIMFFTVGLISGSAFRMADLPFCDYDSFLQTEEDGTGGVNVIRFCGMQQDPNYYAVNVILSMCLMVILNHRGELDTKIMILCLVFLLYCVTLTYSKSSMIMSALPFLMLFYSGYKNGNYASIALIFVGIVLIAVYLVAINPEYLDVMNARSTDGASQYVDNSESLLDSITTGRTTLWHDYLTNMFNDPVRLVFGYGLGTQLYVQPPHNTYIDALEKLGIVGCIFFLINLFSIKKMHYNKRKSILNIFPVLTMLVMYMFLSELILFEMPIHILLAFYGLDLPTKITRQEAIQSRREAKKQKKQETKKNLNLINNCF